MWPKQDLNNAATATILYRALEYMGMLEIGRGDYFPDDGESSVNAEDFFGVWEYVNTDVWLYIHGDGTYEFYNTEGLADAGTYYMDGETLHLSSGIRVPITWTVRPCTCPAGSALYRTRRERPDGSWTTTMNTCSPPSCPLSADLASDRMDRLEESEDMT